MDASVFDEDYFLRGKQTGKSLYEDYHWMPELTMPMVASMVSALGIKHHHRILDYGCARGYVVRAFRELKYQAFGYDVSEWAIANCDPTVMNFVSRTVTPGGSYDWIIAKDVLEHIPNAQGIIDSLLDIAHIGVFAVVPLSFWDNALYICDDYEKDVTHVHRWCLSTWAGMFMRPGWVVEARYHLPWIKQNWYRDGWERGNGFITARRET